MVTTIFRSASQTLQGLLSVSLPQAGQSLLVGHKDKPIACPGVDARDHVYLLVNQDRGVFIPSIHQPTVKGRLRWRLSRLSPSPCVMAPVRVISGVAGLCSSDVKVGNHSDPQRRSRCKGKGE